jgi:hypothetical protein
LGGGLVKAERFKRYCESVSFREVDRSLERDRQFESVSLQQRVSNEPRAATAARLARSVL